MRKIFLAFTAIIVCTSFTQSVSIFNNAANNRTGNSSSAFNYAKFMSLLWIHPQRPAKALHAPRVLTNTYIQIINDCSLHTVASITLDDPYSPINIISGDMPTYSCSGALCDTDKSGLHTMYVMLDAWASDPYAAIEMVDGAGVYHIQQLWWVQTIVFDNVYIDPGGFITIRLYRTN